MSAFLDEVAKKVADEWFRRLVLPGLLYIAVIGLTWPLSPWHAGVGGTDTLRLGVLPEHLQRTVITVADRGATVVGAFVVLLLLASLLAGQAAGALARVAEGLWLGAWPSWARAALIRRRSRSWDALQAQVEHLTAQGREHVDVAALVAARGRRDAIAATRPQHPTWMGDRFAALETLLDNAYHLPLRASWPRMWLILPDRSRDDVQSAGQAFRQQTLVAGWGLIYLATAAYWWPLDMAAALLLVVSWIRGRDRPDEFAVLVEAAVDLHAADLARALGITVDGAFTPDLGDGIRAVVVKTE